MLSWTSRIGVTLLWDWKVEGNAFKGDDSMDIRASYQCSLVGRRLRALIDQPYFIFYFNYLIRNKRVNLFTKNVFKSNCVCPYRTHINGNVPLLMCHIDLRH